MLIRIPNIMAKKIFTARGPGSFTHFHYRLNEMRLILTYKRASNITHKLESLHSVCSGKINWERTNKTKRKDIWFWDAPCYNVQYFENSKECHLFFMAREDAIGSKELGYWTMKRQ